MDEKCKHVEEGDRYATIEIFEDARDMPQDGIDTLETFLKKMGQEIEETISTEKGETTLMESYHTIGENMPRRYEEIIVDDYIA